MKVSENILAGLKEAGWDGESLVAAVSGGGDSLALAYALVEEGIKPVVAHLDHGFRSQSAKDAEFVATQAGLLGLHFIGDRVDGPKIVAKKGGNDEAIARSLRYSFLMRTLASLGGGLIVVAHTADDQAETVLQQIFRGSAYPIGMQSRRGSIVRPMLNLARKDLRSYLSTIGVCPVEDESNGDLDRTRAWFRHEIIPEIVNRYPSAISRLGNLAQIQQSVRADLWARAEEALNDNGLSIDSLMRESLALRRQVISNLLGRSGASISFLRINEILAAADRGRARIQLSPRRVLRVESGHLEVIASANQSTFYKEIRVETASQLPAGFPESFFDRWEDLVIRHRRPGDHVKLSGGRRKLSRWLIDNKVPREDRNSLNVLASGSNILWVQGLGGASGTGFVEPDKGFMERAIELASNAARAGELPVGAVVVINGRIVGEGYNETEQRTDSTAHAEILALQAASKEVGDWRLEEATLYVTLEPCPMCFGACLQSHVQRVVFGATNRREGCLGSVVDLNKLSWKRSLEVEGGMLEEECSDLLIEFFAARR